MCGRECYTGPENVKKPCQMGIWSCDEQGQVTTCLGEVLPGPEVCDSADNDCDGQIDEGLYFCCKPTGPEVCNGKDDDCDGKVDEIEAVEFCYDGQPGETVLNLPCRPGIFRCEGATKVCSGQVLPTAESCDSIDNDCDGQIDEDLTSDRPIDIVFIMDNSGSMTNIASKVMTAVTSFAQKYGSDTKIRWALVAAPPETPKEPDGSWLPVVGPTLITDFTDAATFAQLFSLQRAYFGAGEEPTIDALDMVMRGNQFGLHWGPDSKRVVVILTDEEPQSYSNPPRGLSSFYGACLDYSLMLFVAASDQGWQMVSSRCKAPIREIRSALIATDLESLVDSALCR